VLALLLQFCDAHAEPLDATELIFAGSYVTCSCYTIFAENLMSFKLIAQSVWDNPGNRDKRIRKSLAAVAWQLQKHLLGTTRQLTLPNGVRFKAYPDCVVSSALVYSDWPEYHELMFARSILRPGDVVLDVGANVGHIALLLADVVGPEKVFAFEPAPAAYERLRENWHLNDWPADRLFQVALGADAGSVYLEDAGCPKTTVAVSEEGGGADRRGAARPAGRLPRPLAGPARRGSQDRRGGLRKGGISRE